MQRTDIAGYTYGQARESAPLLTMEDLTQLQKSVMFTDDDVKYLQMAGEILRNYIDDILDVWYNFMGSQPFLISQFAGPDGKPDQHYLSSVRARFGQWILDTCFRPYDQEWLNYQYEIALRHAPEGKNKTDNAQSTPYVPLRHIIALIYPVTATIKPFLARGGHSAEDIDRMHQAWFKSVTIQVALWSAPHIRQDKFEQTEPRASM
jgi:hypothetical protein